MSYLRKLKIVGMAFSRDSWIEKFRNRLSGALKEYTKLWIAEHMGLPDYWSFEVKRLVATVDHLFTPSRTATKGAWNRYRAGAEAYTDSKYEETKLVEAFNEFMAYTEWSAEEKVKIRAFWRANRPDAEDLILDMLERFLEKAHFDKLILALQR